MSEVDTTGWAAVRIRLPGVWVVVEAREAVAGGSFSSPKVARFLEAAFRTDGSFWATSSSIRARAFAAGFFWARGLDLGAIGRSIEESDYDQNGERGQDIPMYDGLNKVKITMQENLEGPRVRWVKTNNALMPDFICFHVAVYPMKKKPPALKVRETAHWPDDLLTAISSQLRNGTGGHSIASLKTGTHREEQGRKQVELSLGR